MKEIKWKTECKKKKEKKIHYPQQTIHPDSFVCVCFFSFFLLLVFLLLLLLPMYIHLISYSFIVKKITLSILKKKMNETGGRAVEQAGRHWHGNVRKRKLMFIRSGVCVYFCLRKIRIRLVRCKCSRIKVSTIGCAYLYICNGSSYSTRTPAKQQII